MQEDINYHGCLCFDDQRVYFSDDEDNLLDDSEDVFMVDTRGSLQHEQLMNTMLQDVGVGEDSASNLAQNIIL